MTARRTLRLVLVCFVILGCGFPGDTDAHRLDEYLQATRISMELSRIGVEMSLTPGAAVADNVIATIDRDRNGTISQAEGAAYVAVVVRSLSLDVDGQSRPLALDGYSIPAVADMRRGEGIIRLRATAKMATASAGGHRLSFANVHRFDIGAYLINALIPSDERIRITGQSRDTMQHEFKMEYKVTTR